MAELSPLVARKILSMQSLDEIEGWEKQARKRGIEPEELAALYHRKKELK